MAAHAIHPPSQKSAMNQEESRIANSLSAMSLASAPGPQGPIRVHFQIGLFKEMLHVPGTQLSFQGAKKLATEIIEKKAPESYVIGSGEKLLLFKHEPHSESVLRKLGEDDTLGNGDLVEVVLAASASVTEMKYRPHSLKVQSYRTPTFCNHCGEMLWGLVRQGLKCEGCGQDFHKRCALALPSNCPRVARRCRPSLSLFPSGRPHTPTPSNQTGGSLEEISMSKTSSRSRPVSWAEKPVWVGVGDVARVPHTFHIHSYTRPTICQHCQRMLLGLFRQGLQCSDCKFNCHWRCKQFVPSNCRGEGRTLNGEDSGSCVSSEAETAEKDADSSDTGSSTMENAIYASYGGDAIAGAGEEPAVPKQEPGQSQVEISPCFSNNIPLMRVVQSVRQTKRRASGVLKKGWLLHYTSSDSLRKRHYWILDAKSITLYQNENSSRYYKEIPLSEVLQIRGPSQMMALPGDSAHSFELVTGTLVYCVVASKDGEAWEMALRQALMPVQNSWHTARDGEDSGKDSGESQGISAFYQIFSDEVLGSGQFGVVYGGVQRQTRRPVAIKVIDKSRFPNKQGRQTKNEVSILQNLSHHGVVTLEGMFETPAHVFVVMEKLHSDMLEMILSSESGRLPERTTRFLVTQVLEALRYLHFLHVAHCDLKPENVLLASPDPFPQVKLCDFGFARIIGKKSFRRSVVGTPAYLAPEVISSSGYNCSLDMWAVGVILYVSLSGTFPFNEDEDLHQQITNATFMYPRHPWAAISLQAVNLINNLLQLVVRRRFSVGKALGHAWLQNYQLWCDLREFEQRVGCRYLTHEEDDERWRRHAQQKGLDFPSNLVTTNVEQDIQ